MVPNLVVAGFCSAPRYEWKGYCPFVSACFSGQRMAKEWNMAAATQLELLAFDGAYLSALHQGDPETERHFVEYFRPLIRAKLRRYLRAPELIEEATQETFMRVVAIVQAKNGVRHPERFGAFVHAVCRNVALEIWRAEQRFVPIDDAGSEQMETDARKDRPFRSPHELAEADEAKMRVRQVLAELSEIDRRLLEAVFLDEEDRAQLCSRLGLSRGHLRVLLHRASVRFRTLMLKESSRRPASLKAKMRRGQRQFLIPLRGGKARSSAL